jgi:hypothetical protein
MVQMTDLWLPILLSSVAVFIASALAWMVMPHHKGEYKKVANEDAFLAAVRGIAPGQYMFPSCGDDPGKIKSDPALKAKMDAGPWGTLNVFASFGNMGMKMFLSFIFYLVVGVFVAYILTRSRDVTNDYLEIFQTAGTVAIMAYCFGQIPHAIWFNKPLRSVIADLFDGVVYGLLTAGFFAWRWPDTSSVW